jgi:uncharacterized protein YcgI (DUF1989 family)
MRLTIELTGFQRDVIRRLADRPGTTLAGLLSEAITFDAARPVDPRWSTPRPRAPRNRARSTHRSTQRSNPRLDAVLPPATGRALLLRRGDRLTIEQLADGQCVDLTARELATGRRLSAARTRAEHGIHPSVGDTLWCQPPEMGLLRITHDTAPAHDLCFPPCSAFEYERLTGLTGHRSCHELLIGATRRWYAQHAPGKFDRSTEQAPDVLNLWLPSEVGADGGLRSWPVACRRGDAVELEVVADDVLVTLSTCPDDLFGSSQYAPSPVRVVVDGPSSEPIRMSRAMAAPRSATARQALTVTLPDPVAEHLDRVRASGWLGTSRVQERRKVAHPPASLRGAHPQRRYTTPRVPPPSRNRGVGDFWSRPSLICNEFPVLHASQRRRQRATRPSTRRSRCTPRRPTARGCGR